MWGTIYQASSAAYQGRSGSQTLYLDDDGRVISPRAMQKVREGDSGARYAEELLVRAGAPQRREGESGAEYLARARACLRKVRHHGNHVYLWGLRKGVRYKSTAPYPKQPDSEQMSLLDKLL